MNFEIGQESHAQPTGTGLLKGWVDSANLSHPEPTLLQFFRSQELESLHFQKESTPGGCVIFMINCVIYMMGCVK